MYHEKEKSRVRKMEAMGIGHVGLLCSAWSTKVSLIRGYMHRDLRQGREGAVATFQAGARL